MLGTENIQNRRARPFTVDEKNSVTALIHYQAHKTGLPVSVIEDAAACFLDVEDLNRLTARHYEAAIRFLVDFHGVN